MVADLICFDTDPALTRVDPHSEFDLQADPITLVSNYLISVDELGQRTEPIGY